MKAQTRPCGLSSAAILAKLDASVIFPMAVADYDARSRREIGGDEVNKPDIQLRMLFVSLKDIGLLRLKGAQERST